MVMVMVVMHDSSCSLGGSDAHRETVNTPARTSSRLALISLTLCRKLSLHRLDPVVAHKIWTFVSHGDSLLKCWSETIQLSAANEEAQLWWNSGRRKGNGQRIQVPTRN